MKLIGSLENFQPSSLLQWFQTERAEGVLAVQCRPGYRLRFERGELVAAAHWPPGESLERRLARDLTEARARELRVEAEARAVPLADLLLEVFGADETARLVGSHAEGVVSRLFEERAGRFFFDPPACDLPSSLRTPLNVSRILLECARRQDEEGRLADWIPSATSPLRLLKDPAPMDDTHTGIRGALVEGLREPRSRQQLEEMIPVESHAVRLKLAELIRSGNIEILPEASVPAGFETRSASTPASVLHLAKSPTADDWPFLTSAEARLLEGLRHGPRSLEEASRTLPRDRQELTPVAELLADSGWISVQDPAPKPRGRRWISPVLAGAAAVAALAVAFLRVPALFQEADADPGSQPVAVEAPAPPAAVPDSPVKPGEPKLREPTLREPTSRAAEPRDPPVSPQRGRPHSVEAAPTAAPPPAAGTPAEAPVPGPATLMVNAIPYGFVRVNGEDRGTTPLNLDLPPGSYEIQVYREGYATIVRRVELTAATVFLESFNLEREDAEDRP